MKPRFRQPEETSMPVTLTVDQFGTQLRADETPHGATMIKSTPKVLINSGNCWGGKQGTTQTHFHEQQKEQDKVKTTFTREVLLTLSRQGMSFVRSYGILALIQDNVEAHNQNENSFSFLRAQG